MVVRGKAEAKDVPARTSRDRATGRPTHHFNDTFYLVGAELTTKVPRNAHAVFDKLYKGCVLHPRPGARKRKLPPGIAVRSTRAPLG